MARNLSPAGKLSVGIAGLLCVSACPAAHGAEDVSGIMQDLVGAGSGLMSMLLVGGVYVVAIGFFVYLGAVLVGLKPSMGDAIGAAIFMAVFTGMPLIAYAVLRLRLDPQMLKLGLIAGLILAGPAAVKTTMGATFWTATKVFLVAAVLTAIIMAVLVGILRGTSGV